jgi:sugar lactone lactonase YvrE
MPRTEVFAEGLHLPECPRWHDGVLWISDMWGHAVYRYDADGGRHEMQRFEADEDPGGLGWLPDGSLLVVGMEGRKVYRVDASGGREIHADLSPLAPWQCNDMIVSASGTAYVSQFGYDLWGGTTERRTTDLLRVKLDGALDVVAEDLSVPNGMALSADGSTLYVAECGRSRVSCFDVEGDGALRNGRVFGDLAPAVGARIPVSPPDGICLDEAGSIWAADPIGGRVVRAEPGGRITHEIPLDIDPLAVVLGGEDRRTLFICASGQHHKPARVPEALGRIDVVTVDVPGAGRP